MNEKHDPQDFQNQKNRNGSGRIAEEHGDHQRYEKQHKDKYRLCPRKLIHSIPSLHKTNKIVF
jgi:hypothetical protein